MCRNVLPIAALFSGTLWMGNAAYLYLSVAFIQMLKVRSCQLLSFVAINWLAGVLLYMRPAPCSHTHRRATGKCVVKEEPGAQFVQLAGSDANHSFHSGCSAGDRKVQCRLPDEYDAGGYWRGCGFIWWALKCIDCAMQLASAQQHTKEAAARRHVTIRLGMSHQNLQLL